MFRPREILANLAIPSHRHSSAEEVAIAVWVVLTLQKRLAKGVGKSSRVGALKATRHGPFPNALVGLHRITTAVETNECPLVIKASPVKGSGPQLKRIE